MTHRKAESFLGSREQAWGASYELEHRVNLPCSTAYRIFAIGRTTHSPALQSGLQRSSRTVIVACLPLSHISRIIPSASLALTPDASLALTSYCDRFTCESMTSHGIVGTRGAFRCMESGRFVAGNCSRVIGTSLDVTPSRHCTNDSQAKLCDS